MQRNPKYLYGAGEMMVPTHLHFGKYLLDNFWTFRDNVAMIDALTSKQITYGEISQQAMNLAVSLTRMGVKKGDVIGLLSENRLEFWSAIIGVICTGAIVSTYNISYTEAELKHVLNISKPKHIICSPNGYQNHRKTLKATKSIKEIIVFEKNIPQTLSFNDLAVNVKNQIDYTDFECVHVNGQVDTLFIIYSSGTTGMPKGVMLTHFNVMVCCSMPASINPNEPVIVISPWYHSMGLIGGAVSLSMGRTIIYLAKFDLDVYLKTIEQQKISNLVVVPPMLVAICKTKSNYDLSSVKLVYSGAAPLHEDTIRDVYKKFPNILAVLQGYGLSETSLAVTRFTHHNAHMGRTKIGSVGQVTPGFIVKITDIKTREVLGPNQAGEICVKGQALMKGYLGADIADTFDDEGFYRTGDVGYYDSDGFVYITDRIKELIKYKGFQVPPAELEAVILTHPSVNDVGVVGVPRASVGEVPLAFVVRQPGSGVGEQDIVEYVAQKLSNPKHLRGGVRFIDAIPKSPSGKILRKELKKMIKGKSKL